MKILLFFVAACLVASGVAEESGDGAAEVPAISISDVSIAQERADGFQLVTVSYRLGDVPAIVTVDFLTNGVSIGEQNFNNVVGAVNRLVTQTNMVHSIYWRPAKSCPGLGGAAVTAKVTAWKQDDPPDYLVVSLKDHSVPPIAYYVSTNALPGTLADDAYRTSRIVMRRIKAANVKWQMGATVADFQAAGMTGEPLARETAHNVTLSYDYFIGIYPVTQEQYRRFTGASALGGYFNSHEDSAIRPRSGLNYNTVRGSGTGVEHSSVSSSSAIGKLRSVTGVDFDLPSDAEWEYACKAGTTHVLYTGDGYTESNVKKIAWVHSNSSSQTHPVGKKIPNAWGLYDMIGNTLEWCRDFWLDNLGTADVEDPLVVSSSNNRVMRGSRYDYSWKPYARTTYRSADIPNRSSAQAKAYGFRVMCPVLLKFPASAPEPEEPPEAGSEDEVETN